MPSSLHAFVDDKESRKDEGIMTSLSSCFEAVTNDCDKFIMEMLIPFDFREIGMDHFCHSANPPVLKISDESLTSSEDGGVETVSLTSHSSEEEGIETAVLPRNDSQRGLHGDTDCISPLSGYSSYCDSPIQNSNNIISPISTLDRVVVLFDTKSHSKKQLSPKRSPKQKYRFEIAAEDELISSKTAFYRSAKSAFKPIAEAKTPAKSNRSWDSLVCSFSQDEASCASSTIDLLGLRFLEDSSCCAPSGTTVTTKPSVCQNRYTKQYFIDGQEANDLDLINYLSPPDLTDETQSHCSCSSYSSVSINEDLYCPTLNERSEISDKKITLPFLPRSTQLPLELQP